ncbi:MAG: glycoside hydrolase family 25 protein [Deltaproteobacteria bacterium]|nr:glycoside hydrolase family 25 protein [Deltaproteobacteria bacterium]
MSKQPVAGSLLGIDVSHWQGKIDWNAVAGSSTPWGAVEFAYAKASTGKGGRDKRFVENAVAAAKAGLPFGAYHWLKPGQYLPTEEAANFVAAIQAARAAGAKVELAPMIDLEDKPASTMGNDPQAVVDYADEFAKAVKAALGQTPILYVGSNYAKQYMGTKVPPGLPIWVPQYNKPSCNYDPTVAGPNKLNAATANWAVWQYCSKGKIPGISGDVDLNALRSDRIDAVGLKGRRVALPSTTRGGAGADDKKKADDAGGSTTLYAVGGALLLLIIIIILALQAG